MCKISPGIQHRMWKWFPLCLQLLEEC
jgi:hypothetical protein